MNKEPSFNPNNKIANLRTKAKFAKFIDKINLLYIAGGFFFAFFIVNYFSFSSVFKKSNTVINQNYRLASNLIELDKKHKQLKLNYDSVVYFSGITEVYDSIFYLSQYLEDAKVELENTTQKLVESDKYIQQTENDYNRIQIQHWDSVALITKMRRLEKRKTVNIKILKRRIDSLNYENNELKRTLKKLKSKTDTIK